MSWYAPMASVPRDAESCCPTPARDTRVTWPGAAPLDGGKFGSRFQSTEEIRFNGRTRRYALILV